MRLADLARSHRLYVQCPKCRRAGDADVQALLARLGPEIPSTELGRHFVCQACGHRGAEITIYTGGPPITR